MFSIYNKIMYMFFLFLSLLFVCVFGDAKEMAMKNEYAKYFVVPGNIDEYVKGLDKGNSKIKKGNEKRVFWNGVKNIKTEYSLVFIHGFATSRLVLEPGISQIAKGLKANYFATRVAGHGLPSPYMDKVTSKDWINSVAEAVAIGEKIGKKVIIVGHSTGCSSVAKFLDTRWGQKVHAVVFISPNFGPKRRASEMVLWPGGSWLIKMINGPMLGVEQRWGGDPNANRLKERFQDMLYKSITASFSVDSLYSMMEVVSQARKVDHTKNKVPILFVYSHEDKVVDIGLLQKYQKRYTGADISTLIVTKNDLDITHHLHIGRFTDPEKSKGVVSVIANFLYNPHNIFYQTL